MKEFLTSKIHNITVTGSNINYTGSIKIDEEIMKKSGLEEYQKVLIACTTNGVRLETYVIKGERGSGIIEVNGAAAKLIGKGEKIIIMGFEFLEKAKEPKLLIY